MASTTPIEEQDKQQRLLETVLIEYTRVPYTHGDIGARPVFDRANDRYLVLIEGWSGYKRIHGVIAHVDIIDGKYWIQYDGAEEGVATKLLDAGVPKDKIVLGFKSEERRKMTEFAVA